MMTTTTQRLLDLAAAAPTADDDLLVQLLREGNALYHQGLQETHHAVAQRLQHLSAPDLETAARQAGVPYEAAQDRDEILLLLALNEWDMTPAAMTYAEMAEDAACRGVCLIPET